ncbi:MAG: hypothetical protein IJ877_04350 [Candidatus Gastranaerophilales bacterium]|nr:hypothetical protein [Candidatus Gastranaerophilales bacterium]
MTQNTISPLLYAKVTANKTPGAPQPVVSESQTKTVEVNSKKNLGKKCIAFGSAMLALSAVTLGIMMYKGRIFPELKIHDDASKVLSKSESLMQEANSASVKAINQYNDVMSILNKGRENNFATLIQNDRTVEFIPDASDVSVIKYINEFTQNGLARQTVLYKDTQLPQTIEEFQKGSAKTNFYTFYNEVPAKVCTIDKGLERISPKQAKSEVSYVFHDDKIAIAKNSVHPSGETGQYDMEQVIKTDCEYELVNGEMTLYAKNYEYISDDMEEYTKADILYQFDDKKLTSATINHGMENQKHYEPNENGKLVEYEIVDIE